MHGGSNATLPCKQQDFQKRTLKSPELLGDPLQIECTMTGGYALLTGPQGKDLIHLVAAQIADFLYELFDTHGLSLMQTVKGYRSCLASVLSHTGRVAEVQDDYLRHDHVYGIAEA